MSPRRVVIVTQAEALLAPKRESEAANRALDRLEEFVKEPEPLTTLVFVAGALDRRGRMFKALAEKGINIQVISTSEIKISVLVAEEYTELAVRALHTAYGLDAE